MVAPLERLRTIMMADRSATRLGPVLGRMWAEGGMWGLFRGNLASVVKVCGGQDGGLAALPPLRAAARRSWRGMEPCRSLTVGGVGPADC